MGTLSDDVTAPSLVIICKIPQGREILLSYIINIPGRVWLTLQSRIGVCRNTACACVSCVCVLTASVRNILLCMALLPEMYRPNSVVVHIWQYGLLLNCIVHVHLYTFR